MGMARKFTGTRVMLETILNALALLFVVVFILGAVRSPPGGW
jgi:hypothetical protein